MPNRCLYGTGALEQPLSDWQPEHVKDLAPSRCQASVSTTLGPVTHPIYSQPLHHLSLTSSTISQGPGHLCDTQQVSLRHLGPRKSLFSLSHSLTLILSGVGTLSNPGPSRRHRSSKQFGDAIFHDMNNCRPGLCELLIEDAAAGVSSGLIHDFSPYTILEVPY